MASLEDEAKAFRFRKRKNNSAPVVIVTPESEIVNQGIRWFFAQGMFAWRNNTGAYKPEGSNRFIRYGLSGSSDVIALQRTGRAVFAEAKSLYGHQTENQAAFQKRVEAAGAIYILYRNVEELEARKRELRGDDVIPMDNIAHALLLLESLRLINSLSTVPRAPELIDAVVALLRGGRKETFQPLFLTPASTGDAP